MLVFSPARGSQGKIGVPVRQPPSRAGVYRPEDSQRMSPQVSYQKQLPKMREAPPRRTIGCTSRNGGFPSIHCRQGVFGCPPNPGTGVEPADRRDTGVYEFTIVFLHDRIQAGEIVVTKGGFYLEFLSQSPVIQRCGLDDLVCKCG